ncbi:MAG TPA: DUF4337 domain-containing protein [Vicinamibacteria bacterium]|nr:DUF4337 domain-containing protein [Vicinamibacteria bacterium]
MAEMELPNPKELEEMREKAFTRRTALVTALYAVVLAVISLGGNKAAKEMSLAQQQASDQWAFYQAKAMREQLYHLEKVRREDDLAERGAGLAPSIREQKQKLLETVAGEETRYEREKKEIEEKARDLEHERDANRSRDPYFDFGEVLLQISIVLASMSILTHSRTIFHASALAALAGLVLGLNGHLMLFRLPFL